MTTAHDVAGRGSGQGLTLTLPHQTSPHPPVSPHGLHRSTFRSSVHHLRRTTKSGEPIRPRYGRNVQSKGNILLVQVPTAAFPTGGSTHGQASSRKSRKQSSPRTCPGWWDLESTEKSSGRWSCSFPDRSLPAMTTQGLVSEWQSGGSKERAGATRTSWGCRGSAARALRGYGRCWAGIAGCGLSSAPVPAPPKPPHGPRAGGERVPRNLGGLMSR